MATRVQTEDGFFIDIDGGEGDRPRGCRWDETVCTAAPTHVVEALDHGEDVDPSLFCGRHYALHLARLVEVHLPSCRSDAAGHVGAFGPLGAG